MLRKFWSLTCLPQEESTPRVDPLFADSITNMRAGTKAERDATAVFGDFIMEKCDSGGRADVLKMLLSACVPVKRSWVRRPQMERRHTLLVDASCSTQDTARRRAAHTCWADRCLTTRQSTASSTSWTRMVSRQSVGVCVSLVVCLSLPAGAGPSARSPHVYRRRLRPSVDASAGERAPGQQLVAEERAGRASSPTHSRQEE
jgi:hypothetical protein